MSKHQDDLQWVIVNTISTFKHRYIVQVPTGICKFTDKPKASWALDIVSMEEALEFSQDFLNETIVDHRVITEKDAIDLWREDHAMQGGYSETPDDLVKQLHFTFWEETE